VTQFKEALGFHLLFWGQERGREEGREGEGEG